MTYHLTVHTVIMPMSKKTNYEVLDYVLTLTMGLNSELEMLRNLKA